MYRYVCPLIGAVVLLMGATLAERTRALVQLLFEPKPMVDTAVVGGGSVTIHPTWAPGKYRLPRSSASYKQINNASVPMPPGLQPNLVHELDFRRQQRGGNVEAIDRVVILEQNTPHCPTAYQVTIVMGPPTAMPSVEAAVKPGQTVRLEFADGVDPTGNQLRFDDRPATLKKSGGSWTASVPSFTPVLGVFIEDANQPYDPNQPHRVVGDYCEVRIADVVLYDPSSTPGQVLATGRVFVRAIDDPCPTCDTDGAEPNASSGKAATENTTGP